MSDLVPNLPGLLDELDEGSLAHQLAGKFRDVESIDAAREQVLTTLRELVEAEKGAPE